MCEIEIAVRFVILKEIDAMNMDGMEIGMPGETKSSTWKLTLKKPFYALILYSHIIIETYIRCITFQFLYVDKFEFVVALKFETHNTTNTFVHSLYNESMS